MKPSPLSRALAVVLLSASASWLVQAEEVSLREAVNARLVGIEGVSAGTCSDAEFLRRASLDLNGIVPSADEVREFLADQDPEKRARLVDRLLASPLYARHMATAFDLMLMERRADKHVPSTDWQAWLVESFAANKPWDVLSREILSADGADPATRAAAKFYLDRDSEPNLLTRDVGRIFFGRDLQCAQCHDHPLIDDYKQADYHGLLAILAPGYAVVHKEGEKQLTLYAEKAGGELKFESVFVKGTPHRTGPRLPGAVVAPEPHLLPGEEYVVAPADGVRSVPKQSRRAALANGATDGTNDAFNRNIANRLWAHLLGRGLVEPLDMHHADNPPTDAELLDLLTERFVAMKYDVREFLRQIALTDAYQRPYDLSADLLAHADVAANAAAEVEVTAAALSAEADASTESYREAKKVWQQAAANLSPAGEKLDERRNQFVEAKKKVDEATAAVAAAETALTEKRKATDVVAAAAAAALQASAALPADEGLKGASAAITSRSESLAAEVAALDKALAEKRTAKTSATEALAAVRVEVDAAVAEREPLLKALAEAETKLLDARQRYEAALHARDAHARRMKTLGSFAELKDRSGAIAQGKEALAAEQAGLSAADAALAEYATVVAGSESALVAAKERHGAAITAAAAALAEKSERVETESLVASAAAAAEAASRRRPEDSSLAETVKSTTDRLHVYRAEALEAQQRLDAATTVEKEATEALASVQQSHDAVLAERSARQQKIASVQQAVSAAQELVATRESEFGAAETTLRGRLVEAYAAASLKPLTPEQLARSMMRASGVYDRQRTAEAAELEKASPLSDEQRADPAALAAREVEIEQRVHGKLQGEIASFVGLYAAAPGQPQGDFFATPDQALFVANEGKINGWLAPANGNVVQRVVEAANDASAAEELYLATLGRLPSEAESAAVASGLAGRGDRALAARELAWALISSAEFRFNH